MACQIVGSSASLGYCSKGHSHWQYCHLQKDKHNYTLLIQRSFLTIPVSCISSSTSNVGPGENKWPDVGPRTRKTLDVDMDSIDPAGFYDAVMKRKDQGMQLWSSL